MEIIQNMMHNLNGSFNNNYTNEQQLETRIGFLTCSALYNILIDGLCIVIHANSRRIKAAR